MMNIAAKFFKNSFCQSQTAARKPVSAPQKCGSKCWSFRGAFLALIMLACSQAFAAAPTVTANTGNLAQNATTLIIAGTNFSTTTTSDTIAFNLGAAGTVSVATATQLTVTLSTLPTSTGSLTAIVTVTGNGSSGAIQVATVVAAPVVTLSTTNRAQNAPSITIAGTNFSNTAANNAVVFNLGAAGTVATATATQLTVTFTTLPTSLGNLTANVTVAGGSSGAVQVATVVAAPTVTLNAASRAQNAPTITIAGTNFSNTAANDAVVFNLGAAGTVAAATATQLTVTLTTLPTSLGNLTANVTVAGGGTGAVQVATVVASPTVTANTANLAQNATTITIAGTNFSTTAANNSVVFTLGAAGTISGATATSLTVTFSTPPTSLGNLSANVTVFGGSSGAVQVATVVAAPSVTANTANLAQNVPAITIAGTNFSAAANDNVVFNLGAAATISAATATQLTVTLTTAPTSVGSLTANVTVFGGSSGAVQVATIVAPATVTASSASVAINASTIIITGTGFSTTAASNLVAFTTLGAVGTVAAATATQLTVTFSTPPNATGALNAQVTVFGGVSNTAQVAAIVPAPTVVAGTASLAQSAPVILINGTNFSAKASDNTVVFNDGAQGTVTVSTATQLTVTFSKQPAAVGSLTAVVTVFGGSSGAAVQVATVVPSPVVTASNVNILQSGATFTITGASFSTTAANNSVALSSGAGTVMTATATLLTVTFTSQPNTGPLTAVVTSNGGSSGAPVKVANVGIAPGISSLAATTFTTTTPGTFTVTGSGTPLPNYTVAPAPPSGVTFADNKDGTATLAGTPTVFGFFNLTITASNGFGANFQQTFVLRINATLSVTKPPDLQAGAAPGQPFIAIGGTAPYLFTQQSGTLPAGTSLSPSGALIGAPTATGSYSFTLAISDSTLPANAGPFSMVANFTLKVTPPNIVITPGQLAATNPNVPYSLALVPSGGNAPYTISLASGTPPPGITLDPSGLVSGSATSAGRYDFKITVVDSTGGNGPYSVTLPYFISVNHPPVIASGPTATPNPALTGAAIQFNASVTDADGDALDYLWIFIDGTTSSLPNPTHVFNIPGSHTVILNVSDRHGGTASGSVVVNVMDGAVTVADTDGDGYSDEIEIALGSDPKDPNSRPLKLPAITGKGDIQFVKLNIGLSFVGTFGDTIQLTGALPLPATFTPAGQTVIVDVGGVVSSYTLQANGKSTLNAAAANAFLLKKPSSRHPNSMHFALVMKGGNFSSALAAYGLTGTAGNASLTVPVTVIVNTTLFTFLAPQNYSSSNFQTGTSTSP